MYRATRSSLTTRWVNSTAVLAVFLGLAVILAGARADAQCSTFASGSIQISPNHGQLCDPGDTPPGPPGDILVANEAVALSVSIVNGSTSATKVFPNCFTNATLTGSTAIRLSCADAGCTTETQQLNFVSCVPSAGVSCNWCGTMPTPAACTAANSCPFKVGGTCGPDPDIVVFTYGGGKALGAASTTPLATINVTAAAGQETLVLFDQNGNYTCGALASRGETRATDLVIAGASGGAQGSAPLFYPGFCGDGTVEVALPPGFPLGETCDPADPNAPAGCRADCTFCGDGTTQSGGVCTSQNTKLAQSCTQNSNCNDKFCSA